MIKPTPIRLYCPKCNFSEIYAPKSDALITLPKTNCPKCNTKLERNYELPNIFSLDEMTDFLKKIFK